MSISLGYDCSWSHDVLTYCPPIVHHYLPQDFNIAIIDMLYLT